MFTAHYILVLRQSTHNICFGRALSCSFFSSVASQERLKYLQEGNIQPVRGGKSRARKKMTLWFRCWQVNRKKTKRWNLERLKQQNIHAQEGNTDCRAAADNSSWVLSQSHELDSNEIIWGCSGVSLILQPALIHLSQKSDLQQRFLQSL